jgi:hypothetical protein
MIPIETRPAASDELALFRDAVRKFFAVHLTPNLDRWEEQGIVDRAFWLAAGKRACCARLRPRPMAGWVSITVTTP